MYAEDQQTLLVEYLFLNNTLSQTNHPEIQLLNYVFYFIFSSCVWLVKYYGIINEFS